MTTHVKADALAGYKIAGGRVVRARKKKRGPVTVYQPLPVCVLCKGRGRGIFAHVGEAGDLAHWRCRDLAYWSRFHETRPETPLHLAPRFWRPGRWR